MNQHVLKQQIDDQAYSLDELLTLVEKAACTIEHLQKQNILLSQRLGEYQANEKLILSETNKRFRRIQQLEQSINEMKSDADRFRWLRNKFSNSLFFSNIEKSYLLDQEMGKSDSDASGALVE